MLRHVRLLSVIALVVLLSSETPAQPQTESIDGTAKRPMSIVDLINVPSVRGIQVSPDGGQILYVLSEADWDNNKTISHIWRVNSDGSGTVQMTNGETGEAGPVWSPDGSRIAFTAKRGDDEHNQIYVLANFGGEARRLSEHPTSVSGLSWSPDGRRIYFRSSEAKTKEEKAREEIEDNVFRFEEDKKNTHIWWIDVETKATSRLTRGDYSVRGYTLSSDGTMLAYLRAPTPLLDDAPNSEVWLVATSDTTGGRQLTSNRVFETGIRISPDNKQISFAANTNDDLSGYYYNKRLFVMSAEGGLPECVVCGGELDVGTARWSASGAEIFFSANSNVRQNVYRLEVETREISDFAKGDHRLVAWDYEPSADLHAFSFSNATNPGDIWISAGDTPAFTQVTHLFDYIIEQFELPSIEAVRWQGEDGVMVEGLLYLPADFDASLRYPLVVQTHGGPASSDVFRFPRSNNYETVLTSMGYVVFKPNYRGSTGYGDAFLRDMVGNYFNQSHKDVMAGVDYLIDRGIADPDRMAKMGWSAGGHMTNKIITYTDRFKAASSGAGAVNWISMYGQSDIRIYRTPWFGGDPWSKDSPIEQYMKDSPLFDVHKVKTPTIILVGENDPRVPMPQSVELYRALKHNGVPTHLYVAPKQGHGWAELQQRLFKANVELDWFEKWVMEREYEWEKSPVRERKEENEK